MHFSHLRINCGYSRAIFQNSAWKKMAVPVIYYFLLNSCINGIVSCCSLENKYWLHTENYTFFLCHFFSKSSVNFVVIPDSVKCFSDIFRCSSSHHIYACVDIIASISEMHHQDDEIKNTCAQISSAKQCVVYFYQVLFTVVNHH